MTEYLRRNRGSEEGGFSLVELLVVILILGILMAIAIPRFLGAKKQGNDSQPQAALRAALSAERTHYIDYQTYTATAADLAKIEPNVLWTSTDAKQGGVMPALVSGGSAVVLVSTSSSGNQFCILSIAATISPAIGGASAPGTYYGKNTAQVSPPSTSVSTTQCSGYNRDPSIGWPSG